MIKTNYKNLLKDNKVSLSNNDDELQLEYKKLINDMKVFNRDYGSLVVSTLKLSG